MFAFWVNFIGSCTTFIPSSGHTGAINYAAISILKTLSTESKLPLVYTPINDQKCSEGYLNANRKFIVLVPLLEWQFISKK